MTGVSTRRDGRRPGREGRRPGRELAALLLVGGAGAGLVLLATRQHLARVIVSAPRPLPATVTLVSAQDLRPAIAALAVAALASLAAVLATRGPLRRLTGLITIALGAGSALLGAAKVTPAAVVAAAGLARSTSASSGSAAGSATAGSGQGSAPGALTGFGSRVLLDGSGWQVVIGAGAALIIAAGIVIVVRSGALPAMSGRYDRPRSPAAQAGPAGPAGHGRDRPPSESMWETLSAGADPTVGPH